MTTNGTLGAVNGKFPSEKRASDQIKRVAAVDIGVVERLLRRKNAARAIRHQKRLPVSAERDAHALLDQLQKAAAQKLRWQRPRYDAVKRPVHTGDIDLNQLPSACRVDG